MDDMMEDCSYGGQVMGTRFEWPDEERARLRHERAEDFVYNSLVWFAAMSVACIWWILS